jgi:photosystem II stability/assembly factor-like uncharacterized protein
MKKITGTIILIMLLTLDGWSQWIPVNHDTTFINDAVVFLNRDTGFVAGNLAFFQDGIIQKTMDGGITWDTTHISWTGCLTSLAVVDEHIAYTGGQDGAVLKTIDGGVTWFFASGINWPSDVFDLYFLNQDTGFALDIGGPVYQTTDGAATWNLVHYTNHGQNYFPNTGKFQFINDTLGFAASGGGGLVLKTIDGGNTWTELRVGDTTMKVNSIFMLNKDIGCVVGDKGTIARTTNGGISWQIITQHNSDNKDFLDIAFFSDSVGYIVGGRDLYTGPNSIPYFGLIYRTNDGGLTWALDDSLCCHWLTAIQKVNDSVGYAVGWNGRILKITNAGIATHVNNPIEVSEAVVFPNPFSDYTRIQVESPFKNAAFTLYNISGQQVKQINNITGNSFSLHRDNLPSGIYFLRLTQDNSIISTYKLVIMNH